MTDGPSEITLDHNTVIQGDSSGIAKIDGNVDGFVFTNNIIPDNSWAVMGSAVAEGTATLNAFFPGWTFQRNVVIGGQSSMYPTANYFPTLVGTVGFVDPSGNFRLSSSSTYINAATDGTAIGASISAINAAAGTSY